MTSRYQAAGVDVNAGYDLVARIKGAVKTTTRPGVMGGLGSFGSLFDLGELAVHHPVLVSGTDGVGTKLLIAQQMDQHATIGIDLVAMCANDILAQGATPLYFLDYLATGHNQPAKLAQIVAGVAAGCRQAGAALIGGETAELPDMYPADEYDLAGTMTGVVEKAHLLTSARPQAGDVLLGLAASGLHSNGFSLVRQILFQDHQVALTDRPAALAGQTVGETLLTPTTIYVSAVLPLLQDQLITGVAPITGGGLIENLPRMFADNLQAQVTAGTWPVPPIFNYLQSLGALAAADCWPTFNMGLGMVLAVAPDQLSAVQDRLQAAGMPAWTVGQLVPRPAGAEKLVIKGG